MMMQVERNCHQAARKVAVVFCFCLFILDFFYRLFVVGFTVLIGWFVAFY